MAYSSVRVQFEIGHEASVRTKKTPEGFTHDWEVFVRGADNTDIQYFVDKVVFHLHETFPKPRRVIKEPPYIVKESGYAGFVLPIDVYLKNKEEPKKISFQYDLQLQPSGPPISRVLREPRLFQNPSEDFRRKLIRGGGVGVDTPSEVHVDDLKSSSTFGGIKPRLAESPIKKQKPSDLVPNDSFAELFGTPIRRVLEPKKIQEIPKKLNENDLSKDKKKTLKHASYKDDKVSVKEKEKYPDKERMREHDKMKDKPPKRLSPIPPLSQALKPKDEHRKHEDRKKNEHDEKKRRKEEKDKKDKTKDIRELDKPSEKDYKKERKELREIDHIKKGNSSKLHDIKSTYEKHNTETMEKTEKEKHKHRHKKKEKEKNRDKEKYRKDKDKNEKESREKDRERDKEKNGKKRHEEIREKEEKIKRKSTSLSPFQERTKKKPLNALLDELGSSDTGSPLSEDEPVPPYKSLSKPSTKLVPEVKSLPTVGVNPKLQSTTLSLPETNTDKETEKNMKVADMNVLKNKKDKPSSKKNKQLDKDVEKRKTKEEHRPRSPSSEKDDDETEKEKLDRDRSEKERPEEEKLKWNKDRSSRKRKKERSEEKNLKIKKTVNQENNVSQCAGHLDLSDATDDIHKSDKFSKEYIAQLRDLQHRIMTMEDNAELQKVVKVIAETGQYEITKKTFDFDLCALDFDTVKRLQEFFSPT